MVNALKKIGQALLIKKQIRIYISVNPLPDTCARAANGSNVECWKTLGNSDAIQSAASKDFGPVLLYPQAVLKQQHIQSNYWDEFDMNLEFNSEVEWYFPKERSIAPSLESKFDFECKFKLSVVHAVRQISKGLGFSTVLVPRRNSENTSYLTPLISAIVYPTTPSTNDTFFLPLSAFDSLVIVRDSTLIEKMLPVASVPMLQNYNQASYLINFESQQIPSLCSEQLYKTLTKFVSRINLGFKFLPLILQDLGNQFEILSMQGDESKEFLFSKRASREPGISMQMGMVRREMTGVYGPLTLGIFERIGYYTPRNFKERSPRFQLASLPLSDPPIPPLSRIDYPGNDEQYLKDNYDAIRINPRLFLDGRPLMGEDYEALNDLPPVPPHLRNTSRLADLFFSEEFEVGAAVRGEDQVIPTEVL